MTAVEKRSVAALALLYMLRMIGLFMVLPVMALYGEDYSASTPLLIGVALGIYGLSQALMQVPMGMLSDRIGRKPVICAGLLMFALGSLIAAEANSVYALIAGRFLQGLGAIASTLSALLSDVTRAQHRSKAMAMLGMSIGLSFGLAIMLGPLLSRVAGLSGLFYATAVFAVLGIAVLYLWVPTPTRLGAQAEIAPAKELLGRCLSHLELMRLNFGVFSLHFVLMAMFLAVPSALVDQGVAAVQHWQVYLPILLLSFLLMVPIMVVAERRQRLREMFLAAIAAIALAQLAMYWLGAGAAGLLLALFVFFFAFNLLEANLPSLLSKTVFPGGRGTAMGVYSSCQFLGAFLGGSLGGVVMQFWGREAVFLLCAVVGLLWWVSAYGMRVQPRLPDVAVDLSDLAAGLQLSERLQALPGVLEVTVLREQRQAYLRVDDNFEQGELQALIAAEQTS